MAPGDGDDFVVGEKLDYFNETNEIVKKYYYCVICPENPSIYVFRKCGHHCVRENCLASCFKAVDGTQSVHTNSSAEMLKCLVCKNCKFCLTDLVMRF